MRNKLHRSRLRCGHMRDPEHQVERLSCKPPERRSRADQVEHQCYGDQWHRSECDQGNGDHIRERAIEAGAVEMEQDDRSKRDLNHQCVGVSACDR